MNSSQWNNKIDNTSSIDKPPVSPPLHKKKEADMNAIESEEIISFPNLNFKGFSQMSGKNDTKRTKVIRERPESLTKIRNKNSFNQVTPSKPLVDLRLHFNKPQMAQNLSSSSQKKPPISSFPVQQQSVVQQQQQQRHSLPTEEPHTPQYSYSSPQQTLQYSISSSQQTPLNFYATKQKKSSYLFSSTHQQATTYSTSVVQQTPIPPYPTVTQRQPSSETPPTVPQLKTLYYSVPQMKFHSSNDNNKTREEQPEGLEGKYQKNFIRIKKENSEYASEKLLKPFIGFKV